MNLETRFKNWQEKMSKKSESEKHNYALTVAFLLGAVATFFVVSTWYFRIYGDDVQTSFFTEAEQIFREQKENLKSMYNKF